MKLMLRKTVIIILAVLFLAIAVPLINLYHAHRQIDSINPRLPTLAQIRNSARLDILPASIEVLNTASQMMPVSTVLSDTEAGVLFEMSFPIFVVTWANGHKFVIDAGLSAETADAFGQPSELLGAEPMQFQAGLGDLLDAKFLKGIGFTHLHSDHVDGVRDLCSSTTETATDLLIVQSIEQYTTTNYTTAGGNVQLDELTCGQRFLVKDNLLLKSISGFPGLYMVHTGGHTPGSQVFVVHVRDMRGTHTYVIAGDLVNHSQAIEKNISKPGWYSRFVVPENLRQLETARIWLEELAGQYKVKILVSHHKESLSDLIQ